jgi:hypothetical protein
MEVLFPQDSERKIRLYEVACCRRVWDLLTDERSRWAVEVVERLADGLATWEELSAARMAAMEAYDFLMATGEGDGPTGTTDFLPMRADQYAAQAACNASLFLSIHFLNAPQDAMMAKIRALGLDPEGGMNKAVQEAAAKECSIVADLIRDILGPLPFRPVTVHPSWLEWKGGTVVQLARSIYEDRRFTDLPILADALEEAGCNDRDILGHCRSGLDHVRGCWVVDLVLGKG